MIKRPDHYTRIAIVLHWVIALLLIGQYIGGRLMVSLDRGAFVYELFQLHKSFGFVILFLSILRLAWRVTHKAPALPESMSEFERIGAKLSHIGFYVFMIGLPMSGWLMVSSTTTKITTKIFKLIKVPDLPFATRSETMEKLTQNIHEYMAYALIALLVLHIGAALKHHFFNKDDVLTRMVPRLKRKS